MSSDPATTAKLLVARLLGENLILVTVRGEPGIWTLTRQISVTEGVVTLDQPDNYRVMAVNLKDIREC